MKTSLASTRRNFLKKFSIAAGAAIVLPQIVPSSVLGRGGKVAPSNRVTLGFIGTGNHGIERNIKRFLLEPDAQILALCDVDADRREKARRAVVAGYAQAAQQGTFKDCDLYKDFRDLIARKDIDAVCISTPDHWHVIPAIQAAKAGKDVICEKPLTLTVHEGRVLADVTKKHRTIFQTASENRSQEIKVYHRACELIRNGRIGELKSIHVELPDPRTTWHRPGKFEFEAPPPNFDYQMWLGQAPDAPYCQARCHYNFRWILDYSGGILTDWGAHLMDIAQLANNTEHTGPISVEGTGEYPKHELYNAAISFDLHYTYANGVKLHVSPNQPAIRFEGTEGWIANKGWASPLEASRKSILDSEIGNNEIRLYTAPNEHRNFLDCVKSRKPCYAPAETGHRTITIAHLGNIAMQLGRGLKWDPEKERFPGDAEANRMLSRKMRAPWKLS